MRTRRYGIWGSAEEWAGKREPYLELGVDHVILDVRPPDSTLDPAGRICRELQPLLAERTAG